MEDNIIRGLSAFGLVQNEATIYAALLKSPKMTISEIARGTGLKRATCYQYLDALLVKDFILRIPVGKRTFYGAVRPQKLLNAAKKRFATLETLADEMEKQYDAATHKPKVRFHEGKRDIKNIYEEMFKTVGDACSIFPPAAFFENFTEQEYDDFDMTIGKHAFKSRDLIVADKYFHRVNDIRKKNGVEQKMTKKLPVSFQSNVDVLVNHDKVALVSLRNLSGLVIEDKDIADLFRNIHSFIWKSI
ncbi:MAG: helix-turn-helix domain-containing protein [Minisyncoccia bacterium]